MNELAGLASFFKQGGLVMYAILGIGVVAAAIGMERFFVITWASRLNGRKLTNDVVNHIQRGDLTSARNVSRMSSAPAAQVVQGVLALPGRGGRGVPSPSPTRTSSSPRRRPPPRSRCRRSRAGSRT